MHRGLLFASIFMMAVHYARPRENAREMHVSVASRTTINRQTGAAMVGFSLANATWSPLYPRSRFSPPVLIEHHLGGQWLTHRRLDMNCIDGWNREAELGINHGAPCKGQLRMLVPGEYRMRVLLNGGAEALSREFRVVAPEAPRPG